MSSCRKVLLAISIALAFVVVFAIGFVAGKKSKIFRAHKGHYVKFYTVKKNLGKEMNEDEKKAIKLFIMSYEECIANKLDDTEKQQLNDVQNEVLDIAEGNNKIKFNIKQLKSLSGNYRLVKKVRRCQKASYKQMTKEDRKVMRKGLSKTAMSDIIAIFHGIR